MTAPETAAIGAYKIRVGQYLEFLNSVARDHGPMGGSPFYYDDDAGFRLATVASG